jgi:hypothetical protein
LPDSAFKYAFNVATSVLPFGDLALVQGDSADQLHVEVPHAEHAPRGLAHERKRFRQQRIQVFSLGVAPLELVGLGAQGVVGQRRQRRLERVGGRHERPIALEQPLIAAAEHADHEIRDGAEHAGILRRRELSCLF